jgi:hypothetical protein
MNALQELMAQDLHTRPLPDGVAELAMRIRERFAAAARAVILYGSCRRRASSEGLVDLLLVVSSYRRAHAGVLEAGLNAVLPPNVYYLETDTPQGRVRCKFAVVSEAAFARRCRGGLDAYFWARFSQPARLVWSADETAALQVAARRADAARRFATESAPLHIGPTSPAAFWSEALAASYRCELRPEAPAAAKALVEADPDYWRRLSALVLPELPFVRAEEADRYLVSPGEWHRGLAAARWALRRAWGKTLNILRLLKAAGTFSNGIDYLLWKVERHSGVRIEPTDRMRRHPRLAAWGLAWRLWRKGAFR